MQQRKSKILTDKLLCMKEIFSLKTVILKKRNV
jgi:hypothetical protein